jgi:hypothetical protein
MQPSIYTSDSLVLTENSKQRKITHNIESVQQQNIHGLIVCYLDHLVEKFKQTWVRSATVCEENENEHSIAFVISTLFPLNFRLHYYYYYYYYY